jgi:predicted metal-dependent enzyme (double-stranded beta helix superfamily)
MSSGIATCLIFRDGRGGLSLFILMVPPCTTTRVRDHLAWGLVGLYAGEQDEEVYEHGQPNDREELSHLKLVATNHLQAGDFYELLPPSGDIHRVRTTSLVPLVSLHLLGNDTGCVWRHRYVPEAHTSTPFRSRYINRTCEQKEIL